MMAQVQVQVVARTLLVAFLSMTSGLRTKLPGGVRNLSRRAAVALVPVTAFPLHAMAARTTGYQDGSSLDSAAATSFANSAGIRGAEVRINGKYEDPRYPGLLRKIGSSGQFVTISGVEEDGTAWVVKGLKSGSELLLDFSPRGGPDNVRATADVLGIKFLADGSRWNKK